MTLLTLTFYNQSMTKDVPVDSRRICLPSSVRFALFVRLWSKREEKGVLLCLSENANPIVKTDTL